MTIRKSTDAVNAALQPSEEIRATVEGSVMPGSAQRGVLALTNQRILFRGSGAGRTVSLTFNLASVSGVELNKTFMAAFVTLFVLGAPQKFRVKYNDAVTFVEAVNGVLTAA